MLPPPGLANKGKMLELLKFRRLEETPHGTDTWLVTLSSEKGPCGAGSLTSEEAHCRLVFLRGMWWSWVCIHWKKCKRDSAVVTRRHHPCGGGAVLGNVHWSCQWTGGSKSPRLLQILSVAPHWQSPGEGQARQKWGLQSPSLSIPAQGIEGGCGAGR